ncbi:MAG: Type 4 prepilin-like proteins leader peptide-processing enzyme [candidate division WS2 bacterium]|uniref:Prepilin leader peptidase/N-methyltransferase n=1 Tax=Psychracetigena formicireducens TaxID=2986056 RepID=A0A9E2F6C2_PSYF1|nr:Type 4 prepilin-like proteins leader peptide-processing enzyme [Candidatus Psychracetigena formicireducens]
MLILNMVIFITGLAVGSFLNVVALRYLKKQSVVLPPSHCPKCLTPLKSGDLIPLVSYLLLKGKCRYCQEAISPVYPIVELLTGVIFLWSYLVFGFSLQFLEFIVLGSFLIVLSIIDFKEFILPDKIVFYSLIAGIILKIGYVVSGSNISLLLNNLAGALIGFLFFYLIFLLYPEGMGGGDVKLSFVLGLFVGFPQIFLWLFLSFFLGSLGGVLYLFTLKKRVKEPLPFGPFLALSALITLSWGTYLINLYLSLIWRI